MKRILNLILQNMGNSSNPILISGHGRSGTTWIGNILAQSPHIIYYNEPCNPDKNKDGDYSDWFKYLRPDEKYEYYENCLDPVFKGLISSYKDTWLRKTPLRRLFSNEFQVVIKEVASYISLEWVYKRYNPLTLVVLRNPCAVALSEKNKNTPTKHAIHQLLKQKSLINDHLNPYIDIMKKAEKPFEIYATIWAARNKVISNLLKKYDNWNVVFYEDFCENPRETFYKTYEKLNLDWTDQIENIIRNTTTKKKEGTHSIYRNTQNQIDKWKQKMNQSQIDQVIKFVEPFNLPFYNNYSDWDKC